MTQAVRREITLQLPHIRLGGWISGQDDKPLLLALHGWLDNANSFAPLSDALDDYRLLAIDWPGHGLSDRRDGSYPLHWIDYLYDLHGVVTTLIARGDKPFAIVAHSLGGIVASSYLASHPDACDALVLIEALGPLTERPGRAKERLVKSFADHLALAATEPKIYRDFDTVVEARHRLTGLEKGAAMQIIARNFIEVEGGVTARTDPRLKLDSPLRLTPSHGEAFVRDLALPSLLLIGDAGFDKLKQAAEPAKALFGQLEVVSMRGCHHLHMTHASDAAAAIRAFLARVATP
ncbi:alpha/beta fold hydrolase [Shewanella sp. JM162201]|uniref:Alpha/beta fold hydrolase n=1 Tax=Shewanella jiangmenensis TaxID=2837387 RepID=A0ABS5V541_9GAMM|nr:alpha/beta fold hydrolase [Shewanella jiangmenensis]MBT1445584.1 alpha/beta fold hydrolase [Shewanella jiangmenensis]